MKCYKITNGNNTIAYTYSKDEAKEFCLINDCVYEKLDEDECIFNDSDFNNKILDDVCGLLIPSYLTSTFKTNLSVLISPLKVSEGVLLMSKKNCKSKEQMKAISVVLDLLNQEIMDIIKMTIDCSSYESIRNEYVDDYSDIGWLTGYDYID